MKPRVKCDTWYIQEYFIYFTNDNEISQSTEHNFENKARDRDPWEQESLCWGSALGWHQGSGLTADGTGVPQPCPDPCFKHQPVTVKSCSPQEILLLPEHWRNADGPISL